MAQFKTSRRLGQISFPRRVVASILGFPFFIYFCIIKFTVRKKADKRNIAERGGKKLYIAWHSQTYSALLFLSEPAFRHIFMLGHQRLASLMQSIPGNLLGVSFFSFLRSDIASGSEQIVEFFKSHEDLLIFVDSGSPYGQVKPGAIRVAEEAGAEIIPVAFRCHGSTTIGRRLQQVIPLPGSMVEMRVGVPVDFRGGVTVDRIKKCQNALESINALFAR